VDATSGSFKRIIHAQSCLPDSNFGTDSNLTECLTRWRAGIRLWAGILLEHGWHVSFFSGGSIFIEPIITLALQMWLNGASEHA
jgi:hypothetical protein